LRGAKYTCGKTASFCQRVEDNALHLNRRCVYLSGKGTVFLGWLIPIA
jgi:hypothetical protein